MRWLLAALALLPSSVAQAPVVPQCRPGFRDATDGKAFEWACAVHCEGGPYAQASCLCACLNDAQRQAVDAGLIANRPAGDASGPAEVLMTARATTSTALPEAVLEASIGKLTDPKDAKLPAPVTVASYIRT
ncbi:unnamed protein product [Effrenium voratum]|nr:unnamed protein product [Effrenium voratum]